MSANKGQERRRSARLADSLSFHLAYDGYDIISDTINVSSSGLLCRIDRAIPLMEKLSIVFVAPHHRSGGNSVKIKAQGVVVRCEAELEANRYQVAIFFTDISESHKKHLDDYVRARLKPRVDA